MDKNMFVQCFIETVSEAALEKYGDYSKFSRVAFEGFKNEAGVWRAIRNARKNGTRRAISLQDMLCVSEALGTPLSELFFRIEQRLKSGWVPEEMPAKEKSQKKDVDKSLELGKAGAA